MPFQGRGQINLLVLQLLLPPPHPNEWSMFTWTERAESSVSIHGSLFHGTPIATEKCRKWLTGACPWEAGHCRAGRAPQTHSLSWGFSPIKEEWQEWCGGLGKRSCLSPLVKHLLCELESTAMNKMMCPGRRQAATRELTDTGLQSTGKSWEEVESLGTRGPSPD